jgi:adenylosuccinate lyase
MSTTFSHDIFLSPFTWRYGSAAMRSIWSETHKRNLWRKIWLELARAQHSAGLVTLEQVSELERNVDAINIDRSLQIEGEIHHDLMAEIQAYAEQCPHAAGIIHLGATSADIEDNTDAIRLRESISLISNSLRDLLEAFSDKIAEYADLVTMAYTHIQPAEPTTLGYRLALYAQDLLEDYEATVGLQAKIRGKGLKGAVGTGASYHEVLAGTGLSASELEARVMDVFDLHPYPITGQIYSRKQDWQVLSVLAGLASSIYKFAFDLRILQSPAIGELAEPFAELQVGSSAMPFKRNPINAEKLNSLARIVAAFAQTAWDNASHSLLERTLDDSANRREMLPVAFLAVDELLIVTKRLIVGLRIDKQAIARNLAKFGVFSGVERVLMEAVKRGGDRQYLHERLRQTSLKAWVAVADEQPNPLVELLATDEALLQYLTSSQIRELIVVSAYVGDAPHRARSFATHLRAELS